MIAFELPIKTAINDYILELIEETIPGHVRLLGGGESPYIIEYQLINREPSIEHLEEVFWNLELMAAEKLDGAKLYTAIKVIKEIKATVEKLPFYDYHHVINNLKDGDVIRFKTGNTFRLGRVIKILPPGITVYQGLGLDVFKYRYKPYIKNINKYNPYGLLACVVEIKDYSDKNKKMSANCNSKGDLFCVCSKQIIGLELDCINEIPKVNEAICQS